MRIEDSRAAREIDIISAPIFCLGAKLNAIFLVTVSSRLVERAPLLLAICRLTHVFASISVARQVLNHPLRLNVVISPIPVFFRLKDGTVL